MMMMMMKLEPLLLIQLQQLQLLDTSLDVNFLCQYRFNHPPIVEGTAADDNDTAAAADADNSVHKS